MDDQQEQIRRATAIIGELFSSSVLRDWGDDKPRRELYVWEQQALDFMREQMNKDPDARFGNDWSRNFVAHGPPPWGRDLGDQRDSEVDLRRQQR